MCDKCGIPHEDQEEFKKYLRDPENRKLVEQKLNGIDESLFRLLDKMFKS